MFISLVNAWDHGSSHAQLKIYHGSCFLAGFIDDFSRVKLNTLPGEEGSDYINASFVDVSSIWQIHCMYYLCSTLFSSERSVLLHNVGI